MEFAFDARTEDLRESLFGFIGSHVYPAEPVFHAQLGRLEDKWARDGDENAVNGRKWWITGAMNPNAKVFVVMGKSDRSAARHRQQSMILVPRDTPRLEIHRDMEVLGYDDHDHGGHAELSFTDARVPAANLIGAEGDGFAIAQARLGPGRIHHCRRSIGVAERAIELMCARAGQRVAFGKRLAEQAWYATGSPSRACAWSGCGCWCSKTAWLMDTAGNKGAAHTEIQVIKIATPGTVQWILDKAIQVHGAGGLSQDFPLANAYANIRGLRFADGPNEVHKNALANSELRRQAKAH